MQRLVIIGNSGGGKSVLARRLSAGLGLAYVEIDAMLWRPGWELAPTDVYDGEHAQLTAQDRWVMEGLGTRASIPARLQRATDVVLIDMPLWVHFWLAAERHRQWIDGSLGHPPANSVQAPPLKALFETIWQVDRDWMPEIRHLLEGEERQGKRLFRINSLEELNSFLPSTLRRS